MVPRVKYFFVLTALSSLLLPAFAQEPTLSNSAPRIDPTAFPAIFPPGSNAVPSGYNTVTSGTNAVPTGSAAPAGLSNHARSEMVPGSYTPARFTPATASPSSAVNRRVVNDGSGAQSDASTTPNADPNAGLIPSMNANPSVNANPSMNANANLNPNDNLNPNANSIPNASVTPPPAEAPVPGNIQPDTSKKSKLEDYTDRLRLNPGMSITFPITEGVDTHRQRIGNYDFTARIHDNNGEEFGYEWYMSSPAEAKGFRAVAPEDEKGACMVSLFYQDKQSCTMSGYMNTVRVSDALYKGLKSGKTMPFQIDLDDSRDVPSRIRMVGREYATVFVDGKKARVRAIKVETDNHWRYWIMDKASFPIIVQGDGPFKWADPRFDSSGAESRRVVNDLEKKGVATTYAILFAFNSAKLENSSQLILNGIATYLNSNTKVRLAVEGHCDIVGSAAYNVKLSQRRADSVKAYLVSKGVAASRLQPIGYGFSRPIADNVTPAGRAKNRRVVFRKI